MEKLFIGGHNPALLCQDIERKLAMWFESKVDAKETFRRGR